MEIIDFSNKDIKRVVEVKGSTDLFIYSKTGGKIDIQLDIVEPDTEVTLYGVVEIGSDDEVSITTTSRHKVKSANSRVHIKTVLKDRAKFKFDGIIKIDNGAILSDAYLQNDNLIVGDDVKIDSLPKLEILADDVKASHGVTVSTFDEEHLYYLLSRGISQNDAEKILCYGFVREITEKAKVLEFPYENL